MCGDLVCRAEVGLPLIWQVGALEGLGQAVIAL